MKIYYIISSMICFTIIISCNGSNKKEIMQARIDSLEKELDNEKNGEKRIYDQVKYRYNQKDYSAVINEFEKLKAKYPGSKSIVELKGIYEESLKIVESERLSAEKTSKLAAEKKAESLKQLKTKYDDVEGITWYKQKYFTHYSNTNRVSIYAGYSKGSSPWLRLTMSYAGDDWIFFKTAQLSFDGDTRTFPFDDYTEKKSDNSGGEVWEWIDISISQAEIDWLRKFANSKNAKMRLSGKYTETRNLTSAERQGILDVLNGYDYLLTMN